ncbi:MAG: hypothetical protein JWP48_89 [Actinoallomurus sp.]|jgi:hypothetical protein|nr:hypothetical protein [Actinoallomurus sp.]
MRLARVASGSATPTVVIMVGPECEGTRRALTQEAAVFSATEPLGSPMPRGRGVMDAAPRHTAVTPLSGEAG